MLPWKPQDLTVHQIPITRGNTQTHSYDIVTVGLRTVVGSVEFLENRGWVLSERDEAEVRYEEANEVKLPITEKMPEFAMVDFLDSRQQTPPSNPTHQSIVWLWLSVRGFV